MNLPDNGLETIIATFLLLRIDEKTLMLRRDKNPEHFMHGKWTPIGGKFRSEDQNDPERCVRREYLEEAGVNLEKVNYRGVVFFDNHKRNFQGKPAKYNFLVHVFEAYSYSGNVNTECDEGSLHWINNSDLRNLDIEKGDTYIFDLLEKKVQLNHRIVLRDNSPAEIYNLE